MLNYGAVSCPPFIFFSSCLLLFSMIRLGLLFLLIFQIFLSGYATAAGEFHNNQWIFDSDNNSPGALTFNHSADYTPNSLHPLPLKKNSANKNRESEQGLESSQFWLFATLNILLFALLFWLFFKKLGKERFLRLKAEKELREYHINDKCQGDSKLCKSVIKLNERESLFRSLVETMPHGIMEIDIAGQITFVNKAANDIFKYKKDELLGENLFSRIFPRIRRSEFADYQAKVQENPPRPPSFIVEGITRDAATINIQVDLNYKRKQKGELIGLILVITDITEQTEKQRKLEESESTARALLMAPTNSVLLLDPVGLILDLNNITAGILQQQREDLLGKSFFSLVPAEIAEQRRGILQEVLAGKQSIRFEGTFGGGWNDSIAYPVLNAEGKVSKIAFLSHDITDRKKRRLN